jgi:glycosyltransferase involved in cell wall biosynthesis
MPPADTLISVCLPVRNGASRMATVVGSIRAQDHANLELVISDNASTDGTEELCRDLTAGDDRVVYVRQRENIGLLNNFIATMRLARGALFRWVSDDDWLAANCLSRCLHEFLADDRLILVTMGVQFVHNDGATRTAEYTGRALGSDDPIERLSEMLRLLNSSYLLVDPLYGLMRRDAVMRIPRRNMLREDQIFAAKLALAGPWAHVQDMLGRRGYTDESRQVLARRFGVPAWTARAATTLQGAELMRWVGLAPDLTPDQRRAARAAVRRWYVVRQRLTMTHRARRLASIARYPTRR